MRKVKNKNIFFLYYKKIEDWKRMMFWIKCKNWGGDSIYKSLKMSGIEDWKIMDIEMRKGMKKIGIIFSKLLFKK